MRQALAISLALACLLPLRAEQRYRVDDEDLHFLRRSTPPRYDLGAGLVWRRFWRDTDLPQPGVAASSSLRERDQLYAGAQAGFRAGGMRLSGVYRQAIDAAAKPSWSLLARFDLLFDRLGEEPFALRLEADLDRLAADAETSIDGFRQQQATRLGSDRYSLNAVGGGDWRFAGAFVGCYYQRDQVPSLVGFAPASGGAASAFFDEELQLHSFGLQIGYDPLEARSWRRGPYFGPFIGGRLAAAVTQADPGPAARDHARRASGDGGLGGTGFAHFAGHLHSGLLWQDGSRDSGGEVFQLAIGARFDWLLLLESSHRHRHHDEPELFYDLHAWGLSAFLQAAMIF